MRCSNRFKYNLCIMITTVLCCSFLSGCNYNAYPKDQPLHISSTTNLPIVRPSGLASDNVVIPYDAYVYDDADFEYEAGLLINQTKNSVVCAVNPHKQIYPASMTKILTAVVVMDAINSGSISLNDTVIIQKKIEFNEENVTALGLEPGDYITVNELLHGLLISSYNDCAIALARYVAGSVNDFVDLMNQKASQLGATNSHFVNPHGLPDDDHYTTAYDLYLIFNAAIKNQDFVNYISTKTHDTSYTDKSGNTVKQTWYNTNGYLTGAFQSPENVTVVGGKTGTTGEAGCCLVLMSENSKKQPVISVVLKAQSKQHLYTLMTEMLNNFSN